MRRRAGTCGAASRAACLGFIASQVSKARAGAARIFGQACDPRPLIAVEPPTPALKATPVPRRGLASHGSWRFFRTDGRATCPRFSWGVGDRPVLGSYQSESGPMSTSATGTLARLEFRLYDFARSSISFLRSWKQGKGGIRSASCS